jgi:exodeoxyribonuclease-3
MRIVSWNVNGIRSRIFNELISSKLKKGCILSPEDNSAIALVLAHDPDIICLQETRCSIDNSGKINIPGYNAYFNESKLDGARAPNRYSGTCIFYKDCISATFETQFPGYEDLEGRIIIMKTDTLTLINVYAPNSGTNYENKIKFNLSLYNFLKDTQGNVILCGDLNVAKETHFDQTKCEPGPGTYPHELKFIDDILLLGYKDAIKCDTIYTWWDPRQVKENGMSRARNRNKGWRLDYFFTKNINQVYSKCLKYIGENNEGIPLASDHAPIILSHEREIRDHSAVTGNHLSAPVKTDNSRDDRDS